MSIVGTSGPSFIKIKFSQNKALGPHTPGIPHCIEKVKSKGTPAYSEKNPLPKDIPRSKTNTSYSESENVRQYIQSIIEDISKSAKSIAFTEFLPSPQQSIIDDKFLVSHCNVSVFSLNKFSVLFDNPKYFDVIYSDGDLKHIETISYLLKDNGTLIFKVKIFQEKDIKQISKKDNPLSSKIEEIFKNCKIPTDHHLFLHDLCKKLMKAKFQIDQFTINPLFAPIYIFRLKKHLKENGKEDADLP